MQWRVRQCNGPMAGQAVVRVLAWSFIIVKGPLMSLAAQLTDMRDTAAKKFPPAIAKIMHDATEDLANSGQVETVIKVGETLPAFSLPNQNGDVVTSADLLARGPLMLTIYRGSW